ncbi:MAG: hypothetical protein AB7J13_12270 [Pyrinomonadaceae bacterium]
MALEPRDLAKIKIMFLKELAEIFPAKENGWVADTIMKRLRDAEADEMALDDPARAEVHRRLNPEF